MTKKRLACVAGGFCWWARGKGGTAVLNPEDRAVISSNGETLLVHQQVPVTNSRDRQVQQTVEQPRKGSVDFAIKKVGYK